MSTCIRKGSTYKRHDYHKGKTCQKCGHPQPEKKPR